VFVHGPHDDVFDERSSDDGIAGFADQVVGDAESPPPRVTGNLVDGQPGLGDRGHHATMPRREPVG
jgi:hypothetical protein